MGLEPQAIKTENDADAVVGIAAGQSVNLASGAEVKLTDGTDDADIGAQNSAAGNGLQVLAARATAAVPTVTEGNVAFLSTDLSGQLRTLATTTPESPGNAVASHQQSLAIAAEGTADLTTAEAASKKLRAVVFSATAQCKAVLHTVDDAIESGAIETLLTSNVQPRAVMNAPHKDYIVLGANAGLDAFRLKVTNLEPSGGAAADVFATFYYED